MARTQWRTEGRTDRGTTPGGGSSSSTGSTVAQLQERLRANFALIPRVEARDPVIKESRAGNGFKRCARVDIVPTGSYQATLSGIGFYGVGFEGFPFETFGVDELFFAS